MCDFEFDPKDIERIRRFRDRFDRYCKKTIYNAAHNLVLMQTQFLILQYGADDADPEQVLTEDDYGDLYAYRLSVRGKEVLIRNEKLAEMLMRLQARKRERKGLRQASESCAAGSGLDGKMLCGCVRPARHRQRTLLL